MQQNFARALQLVLAHEGGYVDHPQDPGGATNKGITLAVFQRYYGATACKEDLRAITPEQVEYIYKAGYWKACLCDALPDGVDYVVFDQAVNSGPRQSVKWLQEVVNVTIDGDIGLHTLAAVSQLPQAGIIVSMCAARLAFLKRLKRGALWQTFGRGWQTRVDGVQAGGLLMADGVSAPIEYDVVRLGSRGVWVEKLQDALDIAIDGVFGPTTDTALRDYQREMGLTVDGVAGRKTYQALGLIL